MSIVDLPDPLRPTSEVTLPPLNSKLIPLRTLPSLASYANSTLLKFILASEILISLASGRLKILFLASMIGSILLAADKPWLTITFKEARVLTG